ncbi:unnamed protein product [Closterium sp. NIES-53]
MVLSRKKQREALESIVEVCKALAGAVPGRAHSLAPRAATSIPGSGGTHSAATCANDLQVANTTPRHPTLSKPLTKLLGRRGLARTLLLLPLATAITSPLNSSTPTATTAPATTPTAATTAAAATPTAATTAATNAATNASTPTTTPTATTATSTASTAPNTASTAATPTTLASLAPATAAPPTRSRCSPDLLSIKEVNSSNSRDRGDKGGGGTPPKEGSARSATRSVYSNYAGLSCKEVLLE